MCLLCNPLARKGPAFNPLNRRHNFRQIQIADDNFKFNENGRKLSKRVENTVGKGQIAR